MPDILHPLNLSRALPVFTVAIISTFTRAPFSYYAASLLTLFTAFFTPLSVFSQGAPIEFIPNQGQWDAPFSYKASTDKGDIFLSANSLMYLVGHPANKGRMDGVHHGEVKGPAILEFHAYKMTFEGAALSPEITASKEQSWYYNYFLGKDQTHWKTGIHPSLALDYSNVYPGIDLHIASEKENLKYEWIVAPGSDAQNIKMRIEGADGLNIRGGDLIIKTSVGDVQELKPVAYQYSTEGRKIIPCRYRLKGNLLSYDLPDDWDKSLPLIIDPTVVFSTLTGSTADNWGYTATYDAQGNFYAGGIMLSYGQGGSFPTTTGAFQVTYAGGVTDPASATSDAHGVGYASDIAIMKLNATGTTRIWATYIGGTDNEQPHSLIVDGNNNLVIAGVSYSTDFPVTTGCYDNTANGGADIVVVKLNPAATALVGSTYIGGGAADGVNFNGSEYIFGNLKHNYGDNARSEVIVDKSNNVYVTASTKSGNFPVTASAYQATSGGGQDGVVMKLNPNLTALTYSTYLGGASDDAGYVLALDTAQTHFYVGGGTQSSNFPTTGGTWKAAYQGGAADGFVARFGNGGAYPLQKICFVATPNEDQVYGVQVDGENSVYAMGQSLGGAFPVTSGVYSNANSSQFIIKLDSLLATDVYSTVIGSGDASHTNFSPVAFLVDTCQNVYLSGWGGSIQIPGGNEPASIGTTTGLPVTPSMLNATNSPPLKATTDGRDFYFVVLSKNAINLLFGAYLGINGGVTDHVDGGTSRFDKNGVIYQGICANCGGTAGGAFPTTPGSWATTVGSSNCNEAAVKIAFNLGAVKAQAIANPNARGCPPFAVQFTNGSINAVGYQWNFADGSAVDTTATPLHTFTTPGIYNVQLIATNPNACKVRDTTYLTITVDSNHVKSAFTASVIDSCNPYRASFTNTSQYGLTPGAQGFTQFTWLFGDGTSFVGANPPIHSYPSTGTYTITLIMRDSTACNNPDTSKKIITIGNNFVKAAFSAPVVCAGKPVNFVNLSTNYVTVLWRFGDGATSTLPSPVHTYSTSGGSTYTVTLITYKPNSCNKIDSVQQTITVKSLPTAAFSTSPVVPIPNTPVQFSNASVNATSYEWTFGDGAGSVEDNPLHLYRHTGHYTACLVAKNGSGCNDTLCKGVDADISTAADLPSAFSPNGDGSNDVLYVRGGAIDKMNLKIFNRWGQLVFESNDLAVGWDGTFNSKPQEMDAYAFVLNVTFIDGTTFMKKGNVTLLR